MLEVGLHLDQEKEKLKKWDEEEDDRYDPPKGKTGKFLRFMMFGSLGLLITFVSLYFMEWAMIPPKITGGV